MIDRSFFTDRLAGLQAEYKTAAGVEAPAVEVLLRTGMVLTVEGSVRAEMDYIVFDYKLRGKTHRAVVPYDGIVAIGFAPEAPDHKNRTPVGFSL